jgi:crotonobetainyl-CoA:carnitine CoA-transferase CaiB-like acyl-CoA transferase
VPGPARDRPGALAGVRVLDLTTERAGGVCTMLLADLGADVVRAEAATGAHVRPPAEVAAGPVCWDRGKTRTTVGGLALRDPHVGRLVDAADVIVVDAAPGSGVADPDDLARRNPRAVVAQLPANGLHGPVAALPADPLLLWAVSGYAQWQTGVDDVPVAPVVPYPSNIQGALGAAAAIAGLLERRHSALGQCVAVSGLHATALLLATVNGTSLDRPMAYSSPRDTRGAASFRLYRCGDGEWFFLGALVPAIFITALDALDLLDVMVMPGIDGEFLNIFVGDNGVRVAERLEVRFAEQPRRHWLDVLAAAGVPAAAVQPRAEWVRSEEFAATGGRVAATLPDGRPVLLPAPPLRIDGAPASAGGVPAAPVDAAGVWRDATAAGAPELAGEPRGAPLAGLRVLDCSTFLAGPTAPTLLGQWGAEVVKVEPPSGDPYRLYNVAYTGANQGKRRVVLDLTTDEGMARLHALVAGADVLVDNFRPSLRAKLGFRTEALLQHNPRLVHVTISAFGDDGPAADAPGFDPVIQACSGLMDACGDAKRPYYTSTPVHDVATGTLALVGALAAVHARSRSGRGGRVALSLAGSSRLVQLEEMVAYEARPATAHGGPASAAGRAGHGYHRAADGWVAVAATTGPQRDALAGWVGDGGAAVARAIAGRSVASVVEELTGLGVPAARVVGRGEVATDPHLAAHDLRHAVHDDEIGRCLVVNQVAVWGRSTPVDTVTGPSREPDEPVWRTEGGRH